MKLSQDALIMLDAVEHQGRFAGATQERKGRALPRHWKHECGGWIRAGSRNW